MKSTYTLDDIQWHQLIHYVAEQFNDLTIKRGFQYYKQGRVHHFTMSDADHIQAVVKGNEEYSVHINLDSFTSNHCSCPVPSNCKHMIAVLLAYANLHERSVHTLVNAHSTAMFKQVVKPTSKTASIRSGTDNSAHRPEVSSQLKDRIERIPTLPISEWHDLFQQVIGPQGMRIPNTPYARSALESILDLKPSLSPRMNLLYKLHAHLFVLNKLVTPSLQQGNNANFYMGLHTQMAADDMQAAIGEILSHELVLEEESEHQHVVQDTLTLLRLQMLTEPQNLHYYYDIYTQLWLHWLHPNLVDHQMYLEELQQLNAAQQDLGSRLSKLPWMLSQIWMQFYLSQDEQAWDLLRQVDKIFNIHPEHVYPFLTLLSKREDWSRMRDWLVELSPLLSNYRNNNLSYYWICWESTLQYLPESEQDMWSALIGMLPHTKHMYEEKLMSYGKWEQWMDYQLSIGRDPFEFRVTVFQPIEKNAPELLLPFYHQAVEQYIQQKNRASYKQAVKLLKRLSKLYKKTKQEDRWDLFITSLANRNSRLRALQEELRRGKLIS
ncbi:SWIM zinc finger family protein [Paenibacillus sp. CMAA1364]